MSSLDPALLAQLGAGGGDPMGGAPAPAPADAAPAGPDITSDSQGDNNDNLRQAVSAIRAYMEGEQDDEDLAAAADIVSKIQKLLAAQQKLNDQAMGAGPGEKFVRKATASASGGY